MEASSQCDGVLSCTKMQNLIQPAYLEEPLKNQKLKPGTLASGSNFLKNVIFICGGPTVFWPRLRPTQKKYKQVERMSSYLSIVEGSFLILRALLSGIGWSF